MFGLYSTHAFAQIQTAPLSAAHKLVSSAERFMSEPLQDFPALSRAQASRHIKPVDNTQHIQRIDITYVIVQRAAAQHSVFALYTTNAATISNQVPPRQKATQ